MASIQQSLNALLGSAAGAATAGTYLHRQTPEYQRSQEIKGLKSEIENITVAQEKLGELASDTEDKYGGDFENTPAYKAADNLQSKLVEKRQRLLQLDWNEDTAKQLANDTAALENINTKLALQKKAESNSLDRLETRTMTAREMLASLIERKDLLSAKERGQLTTMAGRNKDKGGFDK